ncbi:MAG: WYL domain-containing protein [Gammaproteobacteria bacterium]|nr:WYL domain-containing protein [Gammaproteobacteria bacterium]MBU0818875.1 WYL domain-containing protein [Gammaproteobacteria bacterium]MBU0844279.1 WYL domain-containing protein [Gammaproteobacteria bacterium]MBU1843566.1 WYL domain-containing protein [Gammaproteobacteria bacterium]
MINYQRRRTALRKILQRNGQSMSTGELHKELCQWFDDQSLPVKTTLRDLEALTVAELVAKGEDGPDKKSNYWKSGRGSFDLTLSPTEAMTLAAIFDHAERFGFKPHTEQLIELREHATTEMTKRSARTLAWTKRITTGTRFTLLEAGKYDPAHLTSIQEAILADTSLEVTYLPRDAGGVECIYLLKPLALSYQDSNVYLSAYVLEEHWPQGHMPAPGTRRGKYSSNGPNTMCALMLHRMVEVKASWLEISDPDNYDVNSLEAQKHLMTIHGDGPVQLKLRLGPNLQNRLTENPLTEDQVVVQYADDKWDLSCTLHDTQGLRLFLLSNAADIEVLAPPLIRAHVRDTLRRAVSVYAGD